jgi:hypothetical protein
MTDGAKTRDLLETLLFYVGVPAATLYPLGFAGLFFQMWSDQLFPYSDFDTLWDAVATIPNTHVIGTGIVLLGLSLIATLLSAGVGWLTFEILHKRHTADEDPRARRKRRILGSVFALSLLPPAAFAAYNTVYVNDRYDVLCLTGFIAFSAGGGVLVGGIRSRASQEWFRPAAVAAYIGAVFAALCIATLDTPNLPLVEINSPLDDTTLNCSELPKDRTFVKVSQSSNVIYLYNKSGLVAYYIAEIQPIRYIGSCAWLRTQRT